MPAKEADFIVLPTAASDSWRSWLMTGVRWPPFDRGRIRGAHKGLKKLLIEGTPGAGDRPQPWNDFSSAMVRQSVDEALNELPPDQKQAVKLAYFGGFTNREIAQQLGVTEGRIRRRLREALAAVSAQVEQGRMAGRRAVYAIAGWLAARTVFDGAHRPAADQMLQAAAAVTVGVVAAVVLVSAPASPAQLSAPGGIPSAAPSATSQGRPALPVAPGSLPAVPGAPKVPPLPANLPTPVNLPLTLPTPPALPITLPTPSPLPITLPSPTLPVSLPVPTPSLPVLP